MSNGFEITEVADKTFDYVIAGGGTGGLTLAGRLSEDPSVSVVVLEAGQAHLDDPNILVELGKNFANPKYDWMFRTAKQPYSNDRSLLWSRGKGLGGSSGMNYRAWVKPPAAEMDAIEKLGNPGWGWESYLKYSKRSETFHEPTEAQLAKNPYPFSKDNRGFKGPIQTILPYGTAAIHTSFQEAMSSIGIKPIDDPYSGDITGSWIANTASDPETFTRSYATTGYYQPNMTRPNLTVLTEATAGRVLFADRRSSGDKLTATGVEFRWGSDPSRAYVVHARKEVILSTGTMKNPQILELSGIGRKDIIQRLGVDLKIDLPGVGENVQEHLTASQIYEVKDDVAQRMGVESLSFAYFPLSVANPSEASSLVAKAVRLIEEQKASGKLPPGLAEQYDVQIAVLKDESLPDLEIGLFPEFCAAVSNPQPDKKYVLLGAVLNHPLSRGTIHAVSDDPMQQPEFDPHNFENDFDLEMMVQHIKFIKSLMEIEPLKSTIACKVDRSPKFTSDEEIREYIKNTSGTCWHTAGSCSMLPLEKQGVVDPELKVYGTHNLRIVDLSILPLHIAAHTQATVYMIGEKAADLIRGAQ